MTTLKFRQIIKADPMHVKADFKIKISDNIVDSTLEILTTDFKIKISANIVDFTLEILTTALPLCRGTTRRK